MIGEHETKTCIVCGRIAVRWCDTWLGQDTRGDVFFRMGDGRDEYGCDAGLCLDHTHVYGRVCGDRPDTLDACPAHAERPNIPAAQCARNRKRADEMRAEAWAACRRSGMRVVSGPAVLPVARALPMRTPTRSRPDEGGGSVHNAMTDARECVELPGRLRNRRRCPWCPKDSARKASHSGAANGAGMMFGCEWHVRLWVRDPRALGKGGRGNGQRDEGFA